MKKKTDLPDLPKTCEFCELATNIHDDDHVLCNRHGIVSREYSCRKFTYDPLKRVPHTLPMISCLSEEDVME